MIEQGYSIQLNEDELKEVLLDAKQYQEDFSTYTEAYEFFYEAMLTGKTQSYEG